MSRYQRDVHEAKAWEHRTRRGLSLCLCVSHGFLCALWLVLAFDGTFGRTPLFVLCGVIFGWVSVRYWKIAGTWRTLAEVEEERAEDCDDD